MPILIAIDLGTTKITCIAVDGQSGQLIIMESAPNTAKLANPAQQTAGHSEWDATGIVQIGLKCMKAVVAQLGSRAGDVVGIAITGQQHGVVVVDSQSDRPFTPLINWQDRRSLNPIPGRELTWLEAARRTIGPDAWMRTGCWLQPGFMAVTLYELTSTNPFPSSARALFVMDYFASVLTGQPAISEPSCAGSSGVFNVVNRNWDNDAIAALGLRRELFPEIREATDRIGAMTESIATSTGLPKGVPVFVPIGDHQASFLGTVADRASTVLVNVGTGAQVAVYTDGTKFNLPIELRPCPCGGNLLSNVGLAGGWSYQLLEQFFQDIGKTFFGIERMDALYPAMNHAAAQIAVGADGLKCEPRFAGTRLDATVRGTMAGMSPQNLTASHFARSVLEGMSRSMFDGYRDIQQISGFQATHLVAAGNGLRENHLLAEIVSGDFGLPLTFTRHREEAAFGAAVVASVGSGLFLDLDSASAALIHTTDSTR